MTTTRLPEGWELTASAFNWTPEVLRGEHSTLDITATIIRQGTARRIEVEAGQLWRSFPSCEDRESESIRDALAEAGGSLSMVWLGLDDWVTAETRRSTAERFEFLLPQLRAAQRAGSTGVRLPLGQAGPELLKHLLPVLHELDLVLFEEVQGPQRLNLPQQQAGFDTIASFDDPHIRGLIDISMLMPSLPPTYLETLRSAGISIDLVNRLTSEWGDEATTAAARDVLMSGAVPPRIHAIFMNLFVRFGTSRAQDLREVLPLVGGIHLKFWDLDDDGDRITGPIRELSRELRDAEFAGTLCSEWGGHEWLQAEDATEMTERHLAMAREALVDPR